MTIIKKYIFLKRLLWGKLGSKNRSLINVVDLLLTRKTFTLEFYILRYTILHRKIVKYRKYEDGNKSQ